MTGPSVIQCVRVVAFCAAVAAVPLHAKPQKEVSVFVRGRGVLYAPEPVYPFVADALRRGGTGLFVLYVRRDGTVSAVAVVRSTREKELDIAAAQALIRWRFEPNLYERVKVPITFAP